MKSLLAVLLGFFSISTFAQESKLFVPLDFQRAVKRGTRTMNGYPGEKYFQNKSSYKIKAEFNPKTAELNGTENINYKNNSSDTLNLLTIRLYNNIYKPDAQRQLDIIISDLNKGVEIQEVKINEEEVEPLNISYRGTNLLIKLSSKVKPNDSINLNIKWKTILPNSTKLRVGRYDSTSYFVGYWYPQVAVYDDLHGWSTASYTGLQEFYNDYCDFDVELTLPKNQLVWATGVLQNRKDIYSDKILERISTAEQSDSTIQIITAKDFEDSQILRRNGSNIWHFKAQNVTDFAFGVSDHYVWDACSILSKNNDNKRVLVSSVYKVNSSAGKQVADIARYSLQRFADDILGVSYPYPAMTIYEGDSGMEFPMMCNDGPASNLLEKVFVTSHEVGHSYFPFMVGTNETLYGWIDEGLITVIPKVIDSEYGNKNPHYYLAAYEKYSMGTINDVPPIVPSTNIGEKIFMMVNYGRAAAGFYFLRDMMGKELFQQALKEFITRWAGKHPTPIDLLFTLNSYTKNDYSWYWNKWFNEYGYADLAIEEVSSNKITIRNKGNFPTPAKLIVSYVDGTQETIYKTAEVWRNSNTWNVITSNKKIAKVTLGDKLIPDANREDNVFIVKD